MAVVLGIVVALAPVPLTVLRPDTADAAFREDEMEVNE